MSLFEWQRLGVREVRELKGLGGECASQVLCADSVMGQMGLM